VVVVYRAINRFFEIGVSQCLIGSFSRGDFYVRTEKGSVSFKQRPLS
jgi:hypothetical protein